MSAQILRDRGLGIFGLRTQGQPTVSRSNRMQEQRTHKKLYAKEVNEIHASPYLQARATKRVMSLPTEHLFICCFASPARESRVIEIEQAQVQSAQVKQAQPFRVQPQGAKL